jgi:putative component of membrane protein insertase Oxa1/YidC/SpoIIIJ protein YidD
MSLMNFVFELRINKQRFWLYARVSPTMGDREEVCIKEKYIHVRNMRILLCLSLTYYQYSYDNHIFSPEARIYASLRIPLETTNCSFCSTCVNFLTEMSKKVGRTTGCIKKNGVVLNILISIVK